MQQHLKTKEINNNLTTKARKQKRAHTRTGAFEAYTMSLVLDHLICSSTNPNSLSLSDFQVLLELLR